MSLLAVCLPLKIECSPEKMEKVAQHKYPTNLDTGTAIKDSLFSTIPRQIILRIFSFLVEMEKGKKEELAVDDSGNFDVSHLPEEKSVKQKISSYKSGQIPENVVGVGYVIYDINDAILHMQGDFH